MPQFLILAMETKGMFAKYSGAEMRASEHPDVRAYFEGVQDAGEGDEPKGEDGAHGS